MDRKRKAADMSEAEGGKKFAMAASDSPPHMPDRGMGDDRDAVITVENIVIKGYHFFKRRPLEGLNMYVMREWDNPHDNNAYIVQMPPLCGIAAHKHDLITDHKRGTTVKAIAGKAVGRLPAGLCKILADMDKDGILSGPMCAATGPPRQSFPPWPAPTSKGGGAVIPAELYIDCHARDKSAIMEDLRRAVDVHMGDVKHIINIRAD